jgi:pimeloyl-ACP methyl ester carboxylesterase
MNRIQILILTITGGLLLSGCFARTSTINKPGAVADLSAVEIGGMEQWIMIRGEDQSNPVLLWLHGGPGSAQMPVHRAFNKKLENEFVVVHWDQRGAGKSNHRGFSEETMTLNRFTEDVHELTQYLIDRFEQEKIFLLGHSWGSQLGILTVQRNPDDYHAFISVAQVVHPQRAEEISYDWLKQQVEQHGSRRQKRKLEKLGPLLYDEHDRYVTFAKIKDSFGGSMDVGMRRLAWISFGAREYTVSDYVKWLHGANRGSGPMWEELRNFDLFRDIPALGLPVWFIIGSNDYNTPAVLVEEYYEFVDAPRGKELIIMDGTAHTPFMGDPERFNREVIRIKSEMIKNQLIIDY